MQQTVNARAFVVAYLVLAVLGIVVNFPGRLNPDTVDMLWQARNPEHLNTWHSPFVTFVYGLPVPIFGAPAGALVIQSFIMMVWPAALFGRIMAMRPVRPEARTAMILLWLVLAAVIVALNGRILKDVLSLAFLSVLFAAFLFSGRGFLLGRLGYWTAFIATMACVAFALVRPTSVIPFVICFVFLAIVTLGHWRAHARSFFLIGVGGALMAAAVLLVDPFLGAKKAKPEGPTIVFDLAGISHYSGVNLFARFKKFDPEHSLDECFKPQHGMKFIWGDCKEYGNFARRHHKRFFALWQRSILKYPVAYAQHRLTYTWALLSNTGKISEPVIFPPPFTDASNSPRMVDHHGLKGKGVETWSPTIAYRPFGSVAYAMFEGWLGQPLVWVGGLLVGLFVGLRPSVRRQSLGPSLIAVFGLANVVPYALFGMFDVERFLLPLWFCSVALLAILVEWMAERTGAADEGQEAASPT